MRRWLTWISLSLLMIGSLRAQAQDSTSSTASARRATVQAPIQSVEIGPDRIFKVNGQPFFPIMAWLQDENKFPTLLDCGFNTVAGYWPGSSGTKDVAEFLGRLEKAGFYGVMPYDEKLKGNPALLAYIHGDEPDLEHRENLVARKPNATPAETMQAYQQIKAADPTRPIFMTITADFDPIFEKHGTDAQREALYREYIKSADGVGYDLYPIYGWNKPEWLYLTDEATDRLAKLADTKPVYVWIETSKGGEWTGALDKQKDVTPAEIRAEVWMAICRGATAIGYFTHIWKPEYSQFGVPAENKKALREINAQLTRLAPDILGAPTLLTRDAVPKVTGVKIDVAGRANGKTTTLIAVNYDERQIATDVTFLAPGIPPGTRLTVVDENRTIEIPGNTAPAIFSDHFEPLAVHLYQFKENR